MSDFTDGSDALFSMYNEITAERDQKLAENWREDANAIMLLVSQHTPSSMSALTRSLNDRVV